LMRSPGKFERKYLRHCFKKIIQKMKDSNMGFPKDFNIHYLVTEKLPLICNDGPSIQFHPYLQKESAMKECERLNNIREQDFITTSKVIDEGYYDVTLKKVRLS